MTLAELITYLDQHTPFGILDGDPDSTLKKARDGAHKHAVAGEIIQSIADANGCPDTTCTLERADVITSLGPMRLRYMADDAPVEGFRTVEGVIRTIDAAFNDEALHLKRGG